MKFSEDMIISLSVALIQLVVSVLISYVMSRHRDRCTFFTIMWLVYDAITHITLVGMLAVLEL